MPHPAHRVKPKFNSFPASKPLQLKQVSMSSKGSPNILSSNRYHSSKLPPCQTRSQAALLPGEDPHRRMSKGTPMAQILSALGLMGRPSDMVPTLVLWSLFCDSRNSRHAFETWFWILAKLIAFSSIQEITNYHQFPWVPDKHMKILSCQDAHKHPSTKHHQIDAGQFVDKISRHSVHNHGQQPAKMCV